MIDHTRFPSSNCPACGAEHDAATGVVEGTRPKPGDLTLCFDCWALSVFTDANGSRSLWPSHKPVPPDVQELQRKILARLSWERQIQKGRS